jgi:CDP-2,3-bis-(O-geranylgeranyl)-sn-glycerol synthase
MAEDIILALWFFLPAVFANMAPVFSNVIPGINRWNTPMDFGRSWRGNRLLGSHKTWRGLVSGMVLATIVLWLQQLAVARWDWAQVAAGGIDYSTLPVLLLGPAFGLGALGGDAIKSFAKRRLAIPSGMSWIPFDQLDYILGAILLTLPFVQLSPAQYAWAVLLWGGLHFAGSTLGWLMGLKKAPI